MADELADYAFVDAVLVAFQFDALPASIRVVCEAYGPLATVDIGAPRDRGLLTITLSQIGPVRLDAKPEFWVDLSRPYNAGDTYKGDEIILCTLDRDDGGACSLALVSDMLSLNVGCRAAAVTFAKA